MPTYYGDNYLRPVPSGSDAGSVFVVPFSFTIVTALVINDLIKLAPIKALSGIYLLDWGISLPDMDTGGSPTLTLDLGDNDVANKFLAASTSGQNVAQISSQASGVAGAVPCSYTANNDFVLKIKTAPQTSAVTGVIKGFYRYSLFGAGGALF